MPDASGTQRTWRDEEVNYCQWDSSNQATSTTIYQPTATYEEYKENLTDAIDNDLTRHSYIAKCQAQYLKMTNETLGKMNPLF